MTHASQTRSAVTKPSMRRYMLRFAAAMATYFAILLPVGWAAHHGLLPGAPWLYLVALAPAIPVSAIVLVMLRYLEEEEDEYRRMLAVRSYVAATGLTLVVCTGWGYLQDFAGVAQISMTSVFVIFCTCQGVASLWVHLRAR